MRGWTKAAMDEVRSEPTLAVLLALEAIAIERIPATVSALHRALALCHERRVFGGHSSAVIVTDVSPDGALLLTGTAVGSVRLWDRDRSRVLWKRSLGGGATDFDDDVWFVGFLGNDGDRIVAANVHGELVLFDREGEPQQGIVIGRWDEGHRFIANTEADPELLRWMVKEEMVGRRASVRCDIDNEVNIATIE